VSYQAFCANIFWDPETHQHHTPPWKTLQAHWRMLSGIACELI